MEVLRKEIENRNHDFICEGIVDGNTTQKLLKKEDLRSIMKDVEIVKVNHPFPSGGRIRGTAPAVTFLFN